MSAKTYIYNPGDEGCWANGNFGHAHVRRQLAWLIGNLPLEVRLGLGWLRDLLEVDVCGNEEFDAIEVLQSVTHPDLVWEFVDGDLMLRNRRRT